MLPTTTYNYLRTYLVPTTKTTYVLHATPAHLRVALGEGEARKHVRAGLGSEGAVEGVEDVNLTAASKER